MSQVLANDIHDIRSDGFNFADVSSVLIEGNHLHDFRADYGSLDHRDMIQFWTNGTDSPSTDIVIRANRLDMGHGSYTQSIFMRNEAVDSQSAGDGMFYRNIVIEKNSIYNGHLHGITVGETDGLTVQGNVLIGVVDNQNPAQDSSVLWVPAIHVAPASRDVVIAGNVTPTISGQTGQTDWQIAGNTVIQNHDANAPGFYGDVFVASTLVPTADGHRFVALPQGDFWTDAARQGAPIAFEPDGAVFQINAAAGVNTRVFDAGLTDHVLAASGIEGAEYTWDFGDGSFGRGQRVVHDFVYAGHHEVQLTVHAPDGQSFGAQGLVDIRGGKLVSLDGATGSFAVHGFGQSHVLPNVDAMVGHALMLSPHETVASIDAAALQGMRGSNALSLDFTVQGLGTGELFRAHMAFMAEVTQAGGIRVAVYDQAGKATEVTSRGVWVNDGKAYSVSVRLEDGLLELGIDGTQVAVSRFGGTLPMQVNWDLSFGNPWGQKANFDGAILAFDLSAGPQLPPLDLSPEYDTAAFGNAPEIPGDAGQLGWGGMVDLDYGLGHVDDLTLFFDPVLAGFDALVF